MCKDSGNKGIFVGYFESSKAYRIYFPGFKKIDISRDVTFDEDSTYKKSRKRPAEEPKETEVPKIYNTTMTEETRSQSSQNIWLSSVHTHSKRKEDIRKEGYICGII